MPERLSVKMFVLRNAKNPQISYEALRLNGRLAPESRKSITTGSTARQK
jgi:hypothetical protein